MESCVRGLFEPEIRELFRCEFEKFIGTDDPKFARLYYLLSEQLRGNSPFTRTQVLLWYWADRYPDDTSGLQILLEPLQRRWLGRIGYTLQEPLYLCETTKELKNAFLIIARNSYLKLLHYFVCVAIIRAHADLLEVVREIVSKDSSFMLTSYAHHHPRWLIKWDYVDPNIFTTVVRTFPWFFVDMEDWSLKCSKFDTINILRSFSVDSDYNQFPLSKVDIRYFLIGIVDPRGREHDIFADRTWDPHFTKSLFLERLEYVIGLQDEFRLHDYVRQISKTKEALYILLAIRLPDYTPEPGEVERWRSGIVRERGKFSSKVLGEFSAHLGNYQSPSEWQKGAGQTLNNMINELALRE